MWNAAPGTDHGGIPRGNPMSTPDNPGGDTPQDPQNPYGGTPPPPPSDPTAPVPPVTPVPPPAAPYGTPDGPAEPAAPASPTAPPPAYGQPTYGQPAYPQPGQPGQPAFPQYAPAGAAEPGKGMAIGALIASILGCTCIGVLVAVPLAIVVLVRSRDGRNHGKGLAIAALVISVISVIGLGVGGYALYDYAKDFKQVEDLEAGQCITAKGLTDEGSKGVTEIRSVGCSAKHDGEVLATSEITAEEADSYGDTDPLAICTPSVTEAGNADVLTNQELMIIALSEDTSPAAGDKLVCVIANADGSKLTSQLGS
jgi:hypothetical protein